MIKRSTEIAGREISGEEKAAVAVEYLQELRSRVENGELLPLEVFLAVISVMPSVSMECVMLRNNPSTKETEVVLTPRDDDDPVWPGRPLHIPGSVIRVEDIKNGDGTLRPAFERVLRDETPGITPLSEPKLVDMSIGYNERSYGIALIHVISVTGSTESGEKEDVFFPTSNLPDNFLHFQRGFVDAALKGYIAE